MKLIPLHIDWATVLSIFAMPINHFQRAGCGETYMPAEPRVATCRLFILQQGTTSDNRFPNTTDHHEIDKLSTRLNCLISILDYLCLRFLYSLQPVRSM